MKVIKIRLSFANEKLPCCAHFEKKILPKAEHFTEGTDITEYLRSPINESHFQFQKRVLQVTFLR